MPDRDKSRYARTVVFKYVYISTIRTRVSLFRLLVKRAQRTLAALVAARLEASN